MAQDGHGDRGDVLVGNVIALARASPGLRGENDELRGADASPVVHIFLYEVGRVFTLVAGGTHQAHDVAGEGFGDGHHAHELLEVEQVFGRGHDFDLRRARCGGEVDYLELVLGAEVVED